MSVQLQTVEVEADLTVEVSRDDTGTLRDGVRAKLRRVDSVKSVNQLAVTGLTPRLNDVQATVSSELKVSTERDDPTHIDNCLEEGFGITVRSLTVSDSSSPQ